MSEPKKDTRLETATLGGGCFWCLEAVYQDLQGVQRVVSGYAGGEAPNPSYREVCGGDTGHAEVVQLTFDPQVVSYRDLLEVFFSIHDPTTRDRQGADIGSQYRSIVLTHDDAQHRTAEAVVRELESEGVWNGIVTQIEPLETFYPAESYHQNYFRNHPGEGYCQVVIAPKVAKFRQRFAQRLQAS